MNVSKELSHPFKIGVVAFIFLILSGLMLSLGYAENWREGQTNNVLSVSESMDSAFYLMGKKGITEAQYGSLSEQQKAETIILYTPRTAKETVIEALRTSIPHYHQRIGPYEPPARGTNGYLILGQIFAVISLAVAAVAGFTAMRAQKSPVTA